MANKEVTEGDGIELICAVSAKPSPSVEWFRNDEPVLMDSRVMPFFDGQICTLAIKNTQLQDQGIYKCVVRNRAGYITCTADLTVNKKRVRPSFEKRLKDVATIVGGQARFEFIVQGVPSPKVWWYHDTDRLFSKGRYLITEENGVHSLVIRNVERDDLGAYMAVASNDLGRITTRCQLSIQEKDYAPIFPEGEGPERVLCREGQVVSMSAIIRSKPDADVTWFKDGKEMIKNERIEIRSRGNIYYYVITNASTTDSGAYKCVAENSEGTSFRTFDLDVKGIYIYLSSLDFPITLIPVFYFFFTFSLITFPPLLL